MPDRPVILWFRDDLRLADHPALQAAALSGQPVLPVYVLDDSSDGPWVMGTAARWWLRHSLTSLAVDLRARGARLALRRGPAERVLSELMSQSGATALFAGRSLTPGGRAVETRVKASLGTDRVHLSLTSRLFDPETVRTRSGTPYLVYTPFANACRARDDMPPLSSPPDRIRAALTPTSDRLEFWRLMSTEPNRAEGLASFWTPGEAAARARLDWFLDQSLSDYQETRDRPDIDGGSRLSAHLRFGEIAPQRIWHAIAGKPGAEAFRRELLWREFAAHLLWHYPTLPEQPLRDVYAAMPWRDDPVGLHAWRHGRSGIPIVDAGMRALWQTGWMHNRVRMIVGSFLVKHLLIPWQLGEAWFWDTLVDADLANNAMNWQWIAGCGADAAPYFRVYNPMTQGRKFDPDGRYVRMFVPELRKLNARHVHAPWHAPEAVLSDAGIRLGQDYPTPIIDLAAGRQRALQAFSAMRRGTAVA